VVNADATSSSGAYVTFDAGGASCDHASGSLFPVGTTTVTCTAVNAYGTTTESFSVVVNPTFGAPPTLSIPEIVVAEATSLSGTVVTWNAGGATCNYGSGSQFPMGNTTVTCSMTNSYGTSTGSFIIVVTDTIPPSLTLPANINSENQVVTYSASAADNIDGPIPITCNPPSGTTFASGTTTVQCSATDSHLNTAVGSFTVTITASDLTTFTASQNVYQVNMAVGETVTYTSNVPVSLNETLTIQSTITGQTVRTLLNNVARTTGTYQDAWDGKNDAGQPQPDGTYRYNVVVSAAGNSFTWNDNTRYIGTQASQLPYASCVNDAGVVVKCSASGITFDPYAGKPLHIQCCIPATANDNIPCPTSNVPAIVIGKAVPPGETDVDCGSGCFLFEYQSSGTHELTWYGIGFLDIFLGDAPGLTIIRRTDIWPRNTTLLYGTAPSISNLTIIPSFFNPASAPSPLQNGQMIAGTLTSPVGRQVSLSVQFMNMSSGSVLRTVTLPAQASGTSFQVHWDGRADNGAWVAPSFYDAIITATDSAGSKAVVYALITVRYE
jgi:flagellar hook assembly protein FlgD